MEPSSRSRLAMVRGTHRFLRQWSVRAGPGETTAVHDEDPGRARPVRVAPRPPRQFILAPSRPRSYVMTSTGESGHSHLVVDLSPAHMADDYDRRKVSAGGAQGILSHRLRTFPEATMAPSSGIETTRCRYRGQDRSARSTAASHIGRSRWSRSPVRGGGTEDTEVQCATGNCWPT